MASQVLSPHLIESKGVKRCSVCKHPFDADSRPSLSAAFKRHVIEVHKSAMPREAVKSAKRG